LDWLYHPKNSIVMLKVCVDGVGCWWYP